MKQHKQKSLRKKGGCCWIFVGVESMVRSVLFLFVLVFVFNGLCACVTVK